MPVVRAFAGGIVGGTVGAFLAESIDSIMAAPAPWLILIAGLAAGIGTRVACGSSRSFRTGVAAAIAAVLAISVVSYVAAQQSSRSAEESMAQIATKPNFVGDAGVENDADLGDGEESATAQGEAADAESETSPADDSDPENEAPADDQGEESDQDPAADPTAAAEIPGDDRPAQLEPRDEDWVDDGRRSSELNQPTSLPTSVVLFHCLAALVAFVLGSGSSMVAEEASDSEG